MLTNYENKQAQMGTVRIRLNTALRGLLAGTELNIKTDVNGTPLERYWRDRLRDSARDNCIEIIGKKEAVRQQKKKKKSKT